MFISKTYDTPTVLTNVIEKIKDYDLGKLAAETEELILCYSPAYIPPDYRALFMIWRAIVEEIHNKDYILI